MRPAPTPAPVQPDPVVASRAQPPRRIVILCGLPGAGKTSLGRRLMYDHGFHFANIGRDRRFIRKKATMAEIAIDLCTRNGVGRDLVTEGVLMTRARRDALARRLWTAMKAIDPDTARPHLFLIREPMNKLNRRRPTRSVEAYQALDDTLEDGSDHFKLTVIDGGELTTIEQRMAFVLKTIGARRPYAPHPPAAPSGEDVVAVAVPAVPGDGVAADRP